MTLDEIRRSVATSETIYDPKWYRRAIVALLERVDENAPDAERYRYLRDKGGQEYWGDGGGSCGPGRHPYIKACIPATYAPAGYCHLMGTVADEWIDAAIDSAKREAKP